MKRLNITEQIKIKADYKKNGIEALVKHGEKVLTKQDVSGLFYTGEIMVNNGFIIWLDASYPNHGGIMSDIKRKAGEGRLVLSKDGNVYEVPCIADWNWDSETETMYELYVAGVPGDKLEEYLYSDNCFKIIDGEVSVDV